MKKEVSMVLSKEKVDYRKVAKEWMGLTDEQMEGMHVHHNPPQSQGGRNIPEHLYVYHPTLHAEVHGYDFMTWAKHTGTSREQRVNWGSQGGKMRGKKVQGLSQNNETVIFESATEASRNMGINRGHICMCCRGERKNAGGWKWAYLG